ncbi:hypothetical protein F4604DRAFT_1587876, partial [Suillus subluteus]
PTPSWVYGQRVDTTPAGKYWVAGESAGWKVYNTAETDKTDIYKLLISGIVARPIAFVSKITSTIPHNSESRMRRVALFASMSHVTNYPHIISFACNHSAPGRLKDTIATLKNSQGFTVSISISELFVENANATAINAPPGFD